MLQRALTFTLTLCAALTAWATPALAASGTGTLGTVASLTSAPIGEVSPSSCTDATTKQAFAPFGDLADYALAPGGSFEGSLAGWTLDRATVVSGNETAGVVGGGRSLFIRRGGKAISPEFCLSPDHPTFRFMTVGGEVELEIQYRTLDRLWDVDDELAGETTNRSGRWQPSKIHPLATEIPDHKLARGVLARIELQAEDDLRIDNLLIDPYRRG